MAKDKLESAAERLKAGDRTAFDYIYDNTYKVVFFVARGITGYKESAEDVVHDAYMTALKNIDRYESGSFTAWLTTITKRLALNSIKKRNRELPVDFAENPDAYGAVSDDESSGLISTAAEALDETDYRIVIMCAVAGYKRREAAKILDMPVSTVSYRYAQALKTLKKISEGGGK